MPTWLGRDALSLAAVAGYLALVWLPIPVDAALVLLSSLGLIAVVGQRVVHGLGWPVPDLPLLLYLAVSVISIALADDLARSLALSSALLPAAFLYLLTSRYLLSLRSFAIATASLGLAATGLSGLILIATLEGGDAQTLVERASSPLLIVPNDLLAAAIAVPLMLSLAVTARSWVLRVLLAVGILAVLAAIVVAQSRAGLLAAMIGTVLMAGRFSLRMVVRLVTVGLGLGMLVDALNGFALLHKFSSLCFTRGPFWTAAWELFLERPWLGHGAHSFVHVYQDRLPTDPALFCEVIEPRLTPWPHNLFLELLSSQGLLGALPLAAVIVWGLVVVFRIGRCDDGRLRVLAAGLWGAWGAFVFAAIIELSLLRLWVVLWLAMMLGLTVQLHGMARATEAPTTSSAAAAAARKERKGG
jgi:O-antigen ligase